jgi:C4-dicarboxylate-binding protein DctP
MIRVACFCSLLMLALIAPAIARAEPVKLRASLQTPTTNPHLGHSLVLFKEEVEKQSKQSITIEIFDKGKLFIDDNVLQGVQSGAVEIGVAGLNQISKYVPAVDIMEQPFLFNFEALTQAATSPDSELRRLMDTAILETIGVRVLWWQTLGSQVFMSKGQDVMDPIQIKNKKIRVHSETMANVTKHCGGIPLYLSVTKIYDALKDGTIDLTMVGAMAVETRDLWKVTDTITRTAHATIEFLVIMNERAWRSLADGQKNILVTAARNAERQVRQRAAKMDADVFDFARSKGVKVLDLTPDHVAEWRACSAEVLDDYMGSGGDVIRQLIRAYGNLRMDPCCTEGPEGAFTKR